jgi:hypothetical protein
MQHFSLTEWVDFVRDVSVPEQRRQIQEHLNLGCSDCKRAAELWNTVVEFARRENLIDPPLSALRIVKAYCALPQKSKTTDGIEIATLAFDSFRQEFAGERGSVTQMPRQLLFKCGTFCVDVRLEPRPGSKYVVLVGQVIDAKKPLKSFDHVPVSLLSDGDKVSETTTNQFGEFHFGFESLEHMQLFLGMQPKVLVVPLPEGEMAAA